MKPTFQVILTPAAQRELKKLHPPAKRAIVRQLEILEKNTGPGGVKKLSGMDNLYRVRAGDYRIIYTINEAELIILIVKVGT